MTISEGNKLLGEFVESKALRKWKEAQDIGHILPDKEFPYEDLRYHSDLQALTPVICKVVLHPQYPQAKSEADAFILEEPYSKAIQNLPAVWSACVNCVLFYNQQSKNNEEDKD